jgi:hypothetical protein
MPSDFIGACRGLELDGNRISLETNVKRLPKDHVQVKTRIVVRSASARAGLHRRRMLPLQDALHAPQVEKLLEKSS